MKNVIFITFLLVLFSSSVFASGDIDVKLKWSSGSSAIDLDLYVKNPNGGIVNYAHRTSDWGAQHIRDDRGQINSNSYESFKINLDDMNCYATGRYEFRIKHYRGSNVTSVITATINGQAVGGSPWTSNTTSGQDLLVVHYDADQSRCSNNNHSEYPILNKEDFNITYRDYNSDEGVQNGIHTVNTNLYMTEAQYGIVTLYRKKQYGETYRYEFTLSARGSNDIKDVFFIALIKKDSKFVKLPIQVRDSNNQEIIGMSGEGIKVRKGSGDFYSYSTSGVCDGISNAAYAIGGFAIGESEAGTPLAMYGLAKNLTNGMFSALDAGLESVIGQPVGIEADRQKVLPSKGFSNDLADINNSIAYRLVIPTPSNVTSELNGVKFSIDIENNYSSFSEPRFYLSWINEKNIDEQVILELGTKDNGNLRNYDTYIRAASRWIQAYE